MTHPNPLPVRFARGGERSALARRLAREIDGEVLFDAASRGRYSTDASIYQVTPVGVVVPRTVDAAIAAMQIALEEGVAILPRGAGTSRALVCCRSARWWSSSPPGPRRRRPGADGREARGAARRR